MVRKWVWVGAYLTLLALLMSLSRATVVMRTVSRNSDHEDRRWASWQVISGLGWLVVCDVAQKWIRVGMYRALLALLHGLLDINQASHPVWMGRRAIGWVWVVWHWRLSLQVVYILNNKVKQLFT